MKQLCLFFILFICQNSFADIYIPKYREISLMSESCESKKQSEQFFNDIYNFYKSIDEDLPGIPPDKKTYYQEELRSNNINRIATISSDPYYQVWMLRGRIESALTFIKLMTNSTIQNNSNKEIKLNLFTTIYILKAIELINLSEFEYIYNNIKGLKKSNGVLIKIISNQFPSDLYSFSHCSIGKIE